MQKVKKAVIPAAGFGTRFLPATKSQPKEMLPIVDTPVIQYVVQEAVDSGITDILMVIGRGKRAIEEHFDRNFDLEQRLEDKGKHELCARVKSIASMADIHFVWQKEQRGLGDAVRCARSHVGNEPFAVLLGDTLARTAAGTPLTAQLVSVFERFGEGVVALEEVAHEQVSRYGIAAGRDLGDGVMLLSDLVEKPAPEEAPTNLSIASRYVLKPGIFDYLDITEEGTGGEVQLTDAMRLMLNDRAFYGLVLDGRRYDIGNKLDFIKANVLFGLQRPEMKEELLAWLAETIT